MKSEQTIIRPANPDDLECIHKIAVAAWMPIYSRCRHVIGDEIYTDLMGAWHLDWCRFKKDYVEKPPRPWVLVTEMKGTVIGFAAWRMSNPNGAEVGGNAIAPAFQGRGLGIRQIKRLTELMKEAGCQAAYVFTWLDPPHAPARAQYRAAGLTLPITTSTYLNSLRSVGKYPKLAGVEIVTGGKDFAPALGEMVEEVWGPIYEQNDRVSRGLFSLCFPDEIAKRKEQVSKRLNENPAGLLVAVEKERPVGFCLFDMDPKLRVGSIALLGVLPSARGKRVATGLCMEAFRLFAEAGLRHARLLTRAGENMIATRCLASTIGLQREIPAVCLFGAL